MQRVSRRGFVALSVGSIGAALLAACGTQTPPAGSSAGGTQRGPSTGTASPGKLDISGATVSYLTPTGFEKAAREAATEFNQRYGATVNFSLLPTLQLRDKLLAEYTARTGAYDVVNVSPWWIGAFGQYFEPLDQYVKDPQVVDADFDLADWDPQILSTYTTYNSKLVGFPSRADHMMLLYRMDLFDDPKEKDAFKAKYGSELVPPTTWDQFNQVAEFFSRPDKNLWGHAVMGKRSNQSGAQWINRFFGLGGAYFDESGKPLVGSDAGVKTMTYLTQAGQTFAPPGYLTYEHAEAQQALWDGKVAMVESWPGTTIVTAQNPEKSKVVGKVNGAIMPGGHGCGGGWFLAVSADSKNKLAAYKWVEFLSSKKYVLRSYELEGQMPARQSTYKEQALIKNLPQGFPKAFATAYTVSRQPPNQFPEAPELQNELDRAVSEAMAGQKPPSDAMADLQRAWTGIMQRAGRLK